MIYRVGLDDNGEYTDCASYESCIKYNGNPLVDSWMCVDCDNYMSTSEIDYE